MTNVLLIIVIFVIAAGSFFMANTSDAPEGEAFGGTDSIVTEKLEENGVEPWFNPLIELNSGEIESGLFATQAAIGAGLFGFMIGNLRGRTVQRREQEPSAKKTES
ncbi:energy-coupling factor ABC transporter substrate-binding protein [Stomatohabitans albus]|uniref:energy-coupling factor ABC transporter substrate-binding protein n=1 Tax=Stomatohabitans albus TaxID=3110766 RepID=UPI00300CC0A8